MSSTFLSSVNAAIALDAVPSTNLRRAVVHDYWHRTGVILTLAKFPLLCSAAILLLNGNVGLPLLAVVTTIIVADILDGAIYGRSRTVTVADIGRRHIFDAVSDRIVVNSLFIISCFAGFIDVRLYIPVLVREIVLAATVSQPFIRHRRILAANTPSKIATALAGALLVTASGGYGYDGWILNAFTVCAVFGLIRYGQRSFGRD